MAPREVQGELFPQARLPEGTVFINERCMLRTDDAHRLVLGAGIVLWQYALGDRMAEAYAMVSLVEQGWADQNDVARAFGYSARKVRRDQERFAVGGLAALGHGRGYPKGRRRMPGSRRKLIHRLKSEGHSSCAIARRLGISEAAVRKHLKRQGWISPKPALNLNYSSACSRKALSIDKS